MKNKDKTREQLLKEIDQLRVKIAELEKSETVGKQAVEALQKSETLQRTVLDSLDESMHLIDPELRIRFYNRKTREWFEQLGFETESIGKQIQDVCPFLTEVDISQYQQVLETGELFITQEETEFRGRVIATETRKIPLKYGKKVNGVITIVNDITERKQAEKSLRKSEEKYRLLSENTLDCVWKMDKDLKFIYINQSIYPLLGFTREEWVGSTLAEHCSEKELQRFMSIVEDELRKEENYSSIFELNLFHKDGREIPLEILGKILLDENKKILGIQGNARDITERKKAEKIQKTLYNISNALHTTDNMQDLYSKIREFLGDVIDTTNFYVALYNEEHDLLEFPYYIDEKVSFTTYPAEKTLTGCVIRTGKPLFATEKVIEKLIKNGEVGKAKKGTATKLWIGVPLKKGKKTFGVIAVQTYKDTSCYTKKDMEILGFVSDAIAVGIERKLTEEGLRESEKKYRTLTENVNIGIYRNSAGTKGKFIEVNPAFIKIFGYNTKEEILRLNVSDLYRNPKDRFVFNNKLIEKGFVNNEELLLKRKDGSPIICMVSTSVIKDKKGNIIFFDGILEDITESKKLENELKDSEIRYHNLFENSSEFLFTLDLKGNFTDVNKAAESLVGYTKSELLKMNFKDYSAKRDHRKLFRALYNIYKTGKPLHNYPIEAIIKDKSIKYFETSFSLLRKGEQIIGFQGSSKDITERKQAEEIIKAEKEKLQLLMDGLSQTKIGIDIVGLDYKIIGQNQILKDRFGDITGKICYEEYMGFDTPCDFCPMIKAIKNNTIEKVELKASNGRNYEITSAPFQDTDGTVDKVIEVVNDITERKQAVEALEENEERYRQIYQFSPDSIIIHDMDMNILDANNKAVEKFGYSKAELLKKTIFELHPETELKHSAQVLAAMKKTDMLNVETKFVRKDGSIFLAEATPCKYTLGSKPIIHVVIRDITERRRTEKVLKESEEKLRNIFENSTNLFYSHTPEHILTYLSPQVKDILGYTQEEAMIKWTELGSDNPINEIGFKHTVKAIETGKPQPPYELELVHKSGKKVWVEVREAPLVKDGKTVSIVGALTDITERKQTEEDLKKRMNELEIFNDAAVDRELIINEHRKEINELLKKLDKEPKYEIVE